MPAHLERSSLSTPWVQAASVVLDSRLLQISLCLILGVFGGYHATTLALALLLFGGVALIAWLCLLKTNWAICLLILLSPFHFVLKELSSSVVVDLWREIFLTLILASWLLQVLLGKRSAPQLNILNIAVVGYMLWGIVAILNSVNLLVGIAGFRYMFIFVPLYFLVASTLTKEKDIKRIINAVLGSGIVVALIGIAQFVLVSVLAVAAAGSSIDFMRKYSEGTGGALAPGIPWQRATAILIGPNELGVFLAVCLTIMFSYYLSDDRKGRRRGLMVLAMGIMGGGLLASMSRSAILGLSAGCLSVGVVKRKGGKSLLALSVAAILAFLAFPSYVTTRFESVFSRSDPYFTNTLNEGATSAEVWRAPFFGQGFGLQASAAEKLGVQDSRFLSLGGVDMYALQCIAQIGMIGLSLFLLIWLLFLRSAYVSARHPAASTFAKNTAAGIFGAFVVMAVASLHLDVWGYVSLAATYYVLGAMAGFRGSWAPVSRGAETDRQGSCPVEAQP